MDVKIRQKLIKIEDRVSDSLLYRSNLTSDNEFLASFFLSLEGGENIFYSVSGSQFVTTGLAKILKIGQELTFLWPK